MKRAHLHAGKDGEGRRDEGDGQGERRKLQWMARAVMLQTNRANTQRACGPPPRAARSCRSFVQICTAEIEQCGTRTQLRGIDNTLSSAFSGIAHVLSNTISALDASGAHLRHAIVFGPEELRSSEERSRVARAAA